MSGEDPSRSTPSFVQQYDRLFVLTFGLVNLVRGLGGFAAFFAGLLAGPADGVATAGAAPGVSLLALLHTAVLLASGAGLLLRRRWGWTLSVGFHTYEAGKLAGAFLIAVLLGGSPASIQAGTELLAQLAWALFTLLVFLMAPIARLCRVEGGVLAAAVPWMVAGGLLAAGKLAAVT